MNELLKLFLEINRRAFMKAKRLEYAIGGLYYKKKLERFINNFNLNRADVDKENVPVLQYKDYPNILELTRYIRANFEDKYPSYIEIRDVDGDKNKHVVLKLICVGEELKIPAPGIATISNRYGKVYTYQEHVLRNINMNEI